MSTEELTGGSYEIRDGKRVRITPPTAETPGGGARDAQGRPYDAISPEEPEPPKPRRLTAVKGAD